VNALFIHGMGRSPVSAWPMLRKLRAGGLNVSSFNYFVSCEQVSRIVGRLSERVNRMSGEGDYVLIGHSLGGVLIRAVLQARSDIHPPAHAFLLGSPMKAVRLAQLFGPRMIFRAVTGDCGQMLGNVERMNSIGTLSCPTTAIVGTHGLPGTRLVFKDEVNDGIISVSEASADWITDHVHVPIAHSLLPTSPRVAKIILDRLT